MATSLYALNAVIPSLHTGFLLVPIAVAGKPQQQ